MRPRFAAALILSGVLGSTELTACSLDLGGTGQLAPGDSSIDVLMADTTVDTTLDTTPPNEGGEAAVIDSGMADTEAGLGDTGEPEAGCPGVTCNGNCMAASDCRSCSGAPLLCASTGQCSASCQSCKDSTGTPMPIQCFACDVTHQNPIGTCQYDDAGTFCLSGNYLGQYDGGPGYRCECNDLNECPGGTQVCVPLGNFDAGFCLTCGEVTLGPMQGQPCKGGGTCQAAQAVCQ